MNNSRINYIALFLLLTSILFWTLAIIGAFKAYSPVPLEDMWRAYKFYMQARSGDIGVWWEQHNEHRILLAQILFWLDFSLFNGEFWFLLLVNYLLVAVSCVMYFLFIREILPGSYLCLGIFITIWLISWSQYENLSGPFQSQFFLAFLIPLIAFYLLHRAYDREKFFTGACVFGVLSLGTMANGVFVLPLMTLYAAISRFDKVKVALLAALACLGCLVYFYDFHTPHTHSYINSALKSPVDTILYVMTYIGSPFFHITGKRLGVASAQVAGGMVILLFTYCAWKVLRSAKKSTPELALLFFISHVGITIIVTAVGRMHHGVEQSLSSRYQTPMLMAWAALFVLAAPQLAAAFEKLSWQLRLFLLLLLVLVMLPVQVNALNFANPHFERKIAILSLVMSVNDPSQLKFIAHPQTQKRVSGIVAEAAEKGLAFPSRAEFKDINIGEPLEGFSGVHNACQGYIDTVEPVEGESNYLRVSGWMFDPTLDTPSPPQKSAPSRSADTPQHMERHYIPGQSPKLSSQTFHLKKGRPEDLPDFIDYLTALPREMGTCPSGNVSARHRAWSTKTHASPTKPPEGIQPTKPHNSRSTHFP